MIRELNPELAKIAKKELNENPKQIDADLQQIKDWISKQSHLKARTGKEAFSILHLQVSFKTTNFCCFC